MLAHPTTVNLEHVRIQIHTAHNAHLVNGKGLDTHHTVGQHDISRSRKSLRIQVSGYSSEVEHGLISTLMPLCFKTGSRRQHPLLRPSPLKGEYNVHILISSTRSRQWICLYPRRLTYESSTTIERPLRQLDCKGNTTLEIPSSFQRSTMVIRVYLARQDLLTNGTRRRVCRA